MKKAKLFGVIIAVVTVLLVFSVTAYAAETVYTSGDYKYTLTENDTVRITKYTGSSETVTIPEEIDGKAVTHIGELVFGETCPTQKVIIPDYITTIEECAFDFSNVKSVEIGSGVTEIDSRTFFRAWKLEKIIISDENNAYKAVDGILYDKEMKTLLRVPSAITIKKLVIPEGVETIGKSATRFVNLESIVIPSTVKKIDSLGISVNGVKSLIIPGNVEVLEYDAIYYCNGLEKIEIQKGKLKSLDFDDIHACKELKTVIIPENVEYIDRFNDCDSLEEIIVSENNKNYTTTDGVLYNKDKTKIVIYPVAKADETYIIPGSVTVIGEDAFNSIYNKSLKKIYMHIGVKEIEEWAFIYSNGISILYEGTKAQFDAVKKQKNFNVQVAEITYNNYVYRPIVNLKAKTAGTTAKLTWDKVVNAAEYKVYVKTGTGWRALKTTTSTTYTVKNLTPCTSYTFAVKAYSEINGKTVGAPKYSTVDVTTVLGVTSSLTATTTDKTATLKWSAVKGATGYKLYVLNGSKWKAFRLTEDTTYTVKGISAATEYTFAVKAYVKTDSGNILSDKYKSVTVFTKPGVTSSLTATAADETATLKWNAVKGATGYKLYVLNGSKWKAFRLTEKTTYTVKGLTKGTEYTFAVKAYTIVDGTTHLASRYAKITVKTLNPVAKTDGGILLYPVTSSTAKKIQNNWKACMIYDSYEGTSSNGKTIVVYTNGANGWSGKDIEGTQYDTYGKIKFCEYCGLQMGDKEGICQGDCAITFH